MLSLFRKKSVQDNINHHPQRGMTNDAFQNIVASMGDTPNNLMAHSNYGASNRITSNFNQLENMYRSNWLIGKIVDVIAEDMTAAGIKINTQDDPADLDRIYREIARMGVKGRLTDAIRWARLYGGAIAVMLIDGHDLESPLDIKTVNKNSFRGLHVLDRHHVDPSIEPIDQIGPNMGQPLYYNLADPAQRDKVGAQIHHSRCLRFVGIELPENQKQKENGWGASVVERLWDRVVSFDSATIGGAQLLYHSYLRTIRINQLRQIVAQGGKAEAGLKKSLQFMRFAQNNMGITAMDKEDEFQTHNWSFAGMYDAIQAFGEQVGGAETIPLIRLFGQSPKGFASGQPEMDMYYEGILARCEDDLRPVWDKLLPVMHMSTWGQAMPDSWTFEFPSLRQLSETEKAAIASQDTANITNLFDGGLYKESSALKELRASARVTGRGNSITDEIIAQAEKGEAGQAAPGIGEAVRQALGQQTDGFNEGDHPRDKNGEFSSGGGNSQSASPAPAQSTEPTSPEEKQRKIDSVNIDFNKDNTLPGLNAEDLASLGKPDKPVLLKQNIIEKNQKAHPDVNKEDYNKIIGQSLYSPDGVFAGHASEPRFNFVSRTGPDKSTLTLLEMAETKNNYEIINLHWASNRQRSQKERGK